MAREFNGKIALDVRDSVPDWAPAVVLPAQFGTNHVKHTWISADIGNSVMLGCHAKHSLGMYTTETDGRGFEPLVPCGTHAFQACTIDRSVTHPFESCS